MYLIDENGVDIPAGYLTCQLRFLGSVPTSDVEANPPDGNAKT